MGSSVRRATMKLPIFWVFICHLPRYEFIQIESGDVIGLQNLCHYDYDWLSCHETSWCVLQSDLKFDEQFMIRNNDKKKMRWSRHGWTTPETGGPIKNGDTVILDWGNKYYLGCPCEYYCHMNKFRDEGQGNPGANNLKPFKIGLHDQNGVQFTIHSDSRGPSELIHHGDVVYLTVNGAYSYGGGRPDPSCGPGRGSPISYLSGKNQNGVQTVLNKGRCEKWTIKKLNLHRESTCNALPS